MESPQIVGSQQAKQPNDPKENAPQSREEIVGREQDRSQVASRRAVLDAGQWARHFAGVSAPFGRDGLPRVWG